MAASTPQRMLAWLAAHDEVFDRRCEYTVFTVVTPIPRRLGFFDLGDPAAYYAEEAEAVLHPVRAFAAQQGWAVIFEHCEGDAADAVAEAVTQGAFDFVIIGSHGHSLLGNLLLGSVVSGVLACCKTSVLVR